MRRTADSDLDDPGTIRRVVVQRGLRVASIVMVLGLAFLLTYAQMTRTQMLGETRVSLERYLDGTADRPFVYRVLVPRAIIVLKAIVPEAVVRPIATSRLFDHMLVKSREGADPVSYFYLSVILMASLTGYAIVGQRLWLRLFPDGRRSALVPVGLLVLILPFIAEHHGHIYDFSVLFFMMTLLYLIATHRHALFLLTLAISMLNKETTVLILIAYAAYFVDRLPVKTLFLMIGAQQIAFLLIYLGLRQHFAPNSGQAMETWIRQQVAWFFSLPFTDFLSYLGGMLLIGLRWPEKPMVLRRSAWMIAPHLALFLVGALPGEFRNLYESLPLLSLLILRNIQMLVSGSSSDRSAKERESEFIGVIEPATGVVAPRPLGACPNIPARVIRDEPYVQTESVRARCGFPTFPPR